MSEYQDCVANFKVKARAKRVQSAVKPLIPDDLALSALDELGKGSDRVFYLKNTKIKLVLFITIEMS